MKIPTILFFISFLNLGLYAQIELEQTYNHSGALTEICDNEFKYYVMDVPMKQCRIFNEDHTLYKTINLTVPESFFLYDLKFVSRNLFNADDNIELLYIYNKVSMINSQSVTTYGLKVINENGNILLNLPDAAFAEIQYLDDDPKLLTWQYIWYDNYYLINTKVYALGGEATKSLETENHPSLKVFPNPAADHVVLELPHEQAAKDGNIMISDMQGRQVHIQPIETQSDEMTIPTSHLKPGSYILNVISAEGKVSAKKLVKK